MRLGLMIGYSGPKFDLPLATIQEADRLGYYAVWTAEAYGSDSVTAPAPRRSISARRSCRCRRARRP
jgi:alkanesulfonate monooxygenase SsuD/methylene tetrahydromethanopterin reductase-like flavin-dependent oxidoreductase (luciferase family)